MDALHQLMGRKVEILGNDFCQESSLAEIESISEDGASALLRLYEPLRANSSIYEYAVAKVRQSACKVSALEVSEALGFAVTWVPKDRFRESMPFDLSWWRGGGAALTDLRLPEKVTFQKM